MLPEVTFHQCPNEACAAAENGSIILQCRHCGSPFCYKAGVYGTTGCAHTGFCPICGQSIHGARRLGHVLNEQLHATAASPPPDAGKRSLPTRPATPDDLETAGLR